MSHKSFDKRMLLISTSVIGLLIAAPAMAQPRTIPVDDSYTVSSRLLVNQAQHPDFRQPALTMVEGQEIRFDQLYKTVAGRELHADIFLPPLGRKRGQAIVLVHGGGWHSGNKSNFYAIANLLAQRGYVVVLPEFRLGPEAGYPAGLLDVTGDAALTGKDLGRDQAAGKATVVGLLGIDGARGRLDELRASANRHLDRLEADPGVLREVFEFVISRTS